MERMFCGNTWRGSGMWMLGMLLAVLCGACCEKKETTCDIIQDSSQFVTLTDAVPDAILEIRYFGTYNFVGCRIDGYEEPTALMTRQAADSLRAVSDDVMRSEERRVGKECRL